MGPQWPKFEGFGHFLEFESLVFSNFVEYGRLEMYVTEDGGQSAEKKFWSRNLAKWAQNGQNFRFSVISSSINHSFFSNFFTYSR